MDKVNCLKIAVFSDPHYYARELGTSGLAFQSYLSEEAKLLAESSAIVKAAVKSIAKSDASIVLVPGDLTKDGEKLSHEQFADCLALLKASGKKVYVIPGNHDINNPDAVRFESNRIISVENVSPEDFRSIYREFGYGEESFLDPDSLSYSVEPLKGLTIVAMDSSIYENNLKYGCARVNGSFSAKRFSWIRERIKEARSSGNTVIGLTHHGIVKHFSCQDELFKESLVRDWKKIAGELADLGMELVFSGHFHAQSISMITTGKGNSIYDVETGSLTTYPSPYRLMTLNSGSDLTIETLYVNNVAYDTGDKTFADYSKAFLESELGKLVESKIIKFGLKDALPTIEHRLKEIRFVGKYLASHAPEIVSRQIVKKLKKPVIRRTDLTIKKLAVEGIIAHYKGDARADLQTIQALEILSKSRDSHIRRMARYLSSIWSSTDHPDNNGVIDIKH